MSYLKTLTRGRAIHPQRIVLYGTGGIGKTTFASGSPNPIFLCTEDGAELLGVDRKTIRNVDQANELLDALLMEEHEYKTLVIDSVTILHDYIDEHAAIKNRGAGANEARASDFAYGKGKSMIANEWALFLKKVDDVRINRRMNVILIAHEKDRLIQDTMAGSYNKFDLNVPEETAKQIRQWADIVLFARQEVSLTQDSTGKAFGKKRVNAGNRFMYTQDNGTFHAKCRVDLPARIELDYKIFSEHLRNCFNNIKQEAVEKIAAAKDANVVSKDEKQKNGTSNVSLAEIPQDRAEVISMN